MGEHRQDATVVIGRAGEFELHEDAANVRLHGLGAEKEAVADRQVRSPLRHEGQNLSLALSELVERAADAAAADQLLDHRWVDRRPARTHPPDGLGKLANLGDPVLEEMAGTPTVVGEELRRVVGFDEVREHQYTDLRSLSPDGERRHQTLVRVRRRHADIDNDRIRAKRPHQGKELGGVPRLSGDLDTGLREDAGETLPEQDGIVGKDHTHGIPGTKRAR